MPSTRIVGGEPATRQPGAVSIQINHRGDPNWPICTGFLLEPWRDRVLTGAHCATPRPGQAPTPDGYHVRAGSLDRTTGGTVAKVIGVVHPTQWDWTVGDGQPTGDLAILRLDQRVPHRGLWLSPRIDRSKPARFYGWGLTEPDATAPPVHLQQMAAEVVPTEQCAGGFPSAAGELCIDKPGGGGPWRGDGGGPLVQDIGGRTVVVGLLSRGADESAPGHPMVCTDITYWWSWVLRAAITGPTTIGAATGSAAKPQRTS
ncbi:S1 family peptidase [Plantactinospora sp. CA-290183]|uniref:S1 family peptidase n=1 Tax=Plantactinospora sp. CA-290183 TaxID=3240006 RepID=UPI003D91000D